ncbi:MAG: hypothetical protein K6E10_09095 [Eubacterium sp.]|nr:hypothetical protein [Eubacterium sp.]
MKEKQVKTENIKAGDIKAGDIVISLIATILLVASVYICYMLWIGLQHLVSSDGDFFANIYDMQLRYYNGEAIGDILADDYCTIWGMIIVLISDKIGVSPLVLCHKFIPMGLMLAFYLIYGYLGVRLFSIDGKGKLFTYYMTSMFIAAVTLFCYAGAYSDYAIEGGLFLRPWYGMVISGMFIVPLILCTILRMEKRLIFSHMGKLGKSVKVVDFIDGAAKSEKLLEEETEEAETEEAETESEEIEEESVNKVIKKPGIVWWIVSGLILIMELVLLYVIHSKDTWREITSLEGTSLADMYKTYAGTGWLFSLMFVCLAIGLGFRWRSIIAFIIVSILCNIFLVPIPAGLIIAYVLVRLIGTARKPGIWQGLAFVCIIGLAGGYARMNNTSITYASEYEPVENAYRLPESMVKICNDLDESGESYLIIAYGNSLSAIKQMDFQGEYIELTEDLNIVDIFRDGQDQYEFIAVDNQIYPGDAIINNFEYMTLYESDMMNVYVRNYWEESPDGWKHKDMNGEYLTDGWRQVCGKYYYFSHDGLLLNGWVEEDGKTYYLGDTGMRHTGWVEIDGNDYYFYNDGSMARDTEIDGYYVNPDGVYQEE